MSYFLALSHFSLTYSCLHASTIATSSDSVHPSLCFLLPLWFIVPSSFELIVAMLSSFVCHTNPSVSFKWSKVQLPKLPLFPTFYRNYTGFQSYSEFSLKSCCTHSRSFTTSPSLICLISCRSPVHSSSVLLLATSLCLLSASAPNAVFSYSASQLWNVIPPDCNIDPLLTTK